MVLWDLPRTPTSVLVLLRLGEELGLVADEIVDDTEIEPDRLTDPGYTVTLRQEERLLRNVFDALGHPPSLGLKAGVRYHLTTHGMFGYALMSSLTVRDALGVWLRYYDLTFGFSRVRFRLIDAEAHLVVDTPGVSPWLSRFSVERDLAALRTMTNEIFGVPIQPLWVSLAFPAPMEAGPYLEALGLLPRFDAEETVVAFDPALLDLPMPQADAHTSAIAEAQCRALLDQRLARTGLAGQVRDRLLVDPAHPPTADQVAGELSMATRTLRLRLAAEGTSYRALLDEVRERLAESLLAESLTVAEVAARLGYVEVSSFSQAFRRWKGASPTSYRSVTKSQSP